MSPAITTAITIEQRHSTEPTLRSMPPVMMTIVIPIAMMAKKVTLRVVLKRLRGVSKLSVVSDR